ncbi:MAG: AP endonuclease [Candidatus Infernicultor aquiphilus]|uniref:AP endonuclease n=1 Tax=Candidatus Infernicultor aquiphilus TaxID=1805029 RepID=A0A1J5GRG9_9BACT|nr:MAG: AP endonuclease [Candidatus Atribacteria bacterium CG2_30_33_13]PIW11397.1 MAG: AP endonuclease [Candidatus Atribacteria bacterium CG17_big_fil_post_rev_8_21_14_2_50_34_11]PIY31712.1 MAG: AP endonuclease [Candidatus Atribacteria bacterium CG_4_10_14_3_um_filter_34_13]
MNRPITIFTGQWADLSFEEVSKLMSGIGYDGLEIACWGDHMDVERAAKDMSYVEEKKAILEKYNLKCWALSNHLAGQCVGDLYDKRLDNFVPDKVKGNPEKIREWAIKEMKYAPRAAKNMGCSLVIGFTGSPIWKYFYSFPQTPEKMIEEAYQEIVKLWTPIFDEFDYYEIKFALEIHPTEIAYDYYTTKRLLEAFDYRPTLGINFDPSHLIWQGVTPHILIRDFPERIYHVHMKDAAVTLDGKSGILGSHLAFGDLRRGWNFRSLGHGNVNFEEIIRELNANNYTGPLSVEWEDSAMDRVHGAKESLEFVRKINFNSNIAAFDDAMKN